MLEPDVSKMPETDRQEMLGREPARGNIVVDHLGHIGRDDPAGEVHGRNSAGGQGIEGASCIDVGNHAIDA